MLLRATRVIGNTLLVLAFVAAITTPGIAMLLRTEAPQTAATENRVLASKPEWSWNRAAIDAFPQAFEKYFNDVFGLRDVLTRWHHVANFRVFGNSPTSVVVVGKDNWLFLDDSIKQYRREASFTDQEIAKQAALLQQRHDWLAWRGIKYLVVIVPNKPEVYPEYVPASATQRDVENNTDRLEAYVKANCSFELLNLRPALAEASKKQLTYNPADCHWNDYGAYVGYKAVIDRVKKHFPQVEPLTPEQCSIESRQATGDLMHIMGFPDLTEPRVFMKPAKPRMHGERWTPRVGSTVVMKVDDERLPKAVVMHDSFMTAMYPFLAENFQETTFHWIYGDINPKPIVEHKPDIVIQEIVERAMLHLNKNPPHVRPPSETPNPPRPRLAEGPAGSTRS